ncbi:hypothetical protein E2562_006261 [Oryza meyeriana var. granulata]|uniref:Uncharacterized protein n=1 Tax=Oryza meyeriana var. granulata TaxID=110450 RepID=A0A6G1EEW1_9ORYZ|nr:hypothetical protein E2562_006261 [Oryza meyeriana var. granulata]
MLHLLLAHPVVRYPSNLAPLLRVNFTCAFRSRPAWAFLSTHKPSRLEWGLCASCRYGAGLCVRDAACYLP